MIFMIVDGTDMIFGRLASQIAKKLMRGEEVHLINAEKLVIVGNPKQISQRYLTKRGLRNKGTPERSPVWSKVPHLLVKRMIRGMLPRESSRGKLALKRLRVYSGNPKKLEGAAKMEGASYDGISKRITIHELCKSIGYSG
ncbi:MAG: 50S ribosomal protein L13 [Candidatus Micrarchaeia archaeon]